MSVVSLVDKTVVIVRRDLLTAVRYRTGFLLNAAGAITELAAFYYLSRAVGPGFRPEGLEYFSFLLVGTGFYAFASWASMRSCKPCRKPSRPARWRF